MSNEILEKPIFHFTNIQNLESIVEEGLRCDNSGAGFVRISHPQITQRRSHRPVPVRPWGFVGDYAPFYFAARSPMLFAIHKGNVPQYEMGQANIIYIQTRIRNVIEANMRWVASDRNAVLDDAQFGNSLAWLRKNINWNLMAAPNWAGLVPQRMAEFLIRPEVPWSAIRGVATRTVDELDSVNAILRRCGVKTPTRVIPGWYF